MPFEPHPEPLTGALEVSPELALVDPHLGDLARRRLPDPDDTISRIENLVWRRRAASLEGGLSSVGPNASKRRAGTASRSTGRRRVRLVAIGGIAVLAAGAILAGVRVNFDGAPAGADPTTVGTTEAAETPATAISPTINEPERSATEATTGPRRLAWAPIAKATGYHVELFRGSALVFVTETRRPQVVVPAEWQFDERAQRLIPGEYRWYVWPLVLGRRQSQATVQATLVVPTS